MGNHYHSDLDGLREKAKWSNQAKQFTESGSLFVPEPVMLVMSGAEYNLVLEQMYKILESGESLETKKTALSLIKHMESDDNE
jgi:hypothetical protein